MASQEAKTYKLIFKPGLEPHVGFSEEHDYPFIISHKFTKAVEKVGLQDALVKYGSLDLRKKTYEEYIEERAKNKPITVRKLTFLESVFPEDYLNPDVHRKVLF